MADIIIVTPDIVGPIKNGGIGTACYHYARTLSKAGYSVDILFTGTVDEPDRCHWRAVYDRYKIGFFSLADLDAEKGIIHGIRWYTQRSWAVLQFLKQRHDRYILFQDWHANGFWSARAKRMGYAFHEATLGLIAHSPTEWQQAGMQTFGSSPLEDADLSWTERESIAQVDCLISPSRHMVDWLRKHDYQIPKDVAICPIPFEDEASLTPYTPDLDHLIFFGRLETRKGLHLLAGALRGMSSQQLPKKLSLLGKYATVEGLRSELYIERLRHEIPSVEIQVQTDFDYSRAISYIAREKGLVVMPSTLDNFPLTIVECITNGFHFVASNVGGIPEIADSRVLFEPSCRAIQRLLEQRHQIQFRDVHHPYRPEEARSVWLDHVESKLPKGSAPAVISDSQRGTSVCIPFYKHDRYLRRVLSSFLRMRRSDIQLVLVNDGTPEIECPQFYEMAGKLSRLGHVFHTQENGGPGSARNKAAVLAKYERILFFDADNVAFPNLVSALESALSASSIDILSAPFIAVPAMEREPVLSDAIFSYRPSGGSLPMSIFDNCFGDMCCMMNRRVLEEIGWLHTGRFYIEDWEMYLQAHGKGLRQWVYPEPLFFYTHEEHERRTAIGQYTNFTQLWSRLEQFDHKSLASVTRSLAKEVYVRVQNRS